MIELKEVSENVVKHDDPKVVKEYIATQDFVVDFYAKKHEEERRRAILPNILKVLVAAIVGAGLMYGYMKFNEAIDLQKQVKTVDEIHNEMLKHNYAYCPYCGESFKKVQDKVDE